MFKSYIVSRTGIKYNKEQCASIIEEYWKLSDANSGYWSPMSVLAMPGVPILSQSPGCCGKPVGQQQDLDRSKTK